MTTNIEFPEPLRCLFLPKRTKVLYGGRGAGRSWGAARALLLQGTTAPLRNLCVRELQNSMADSVHKLLSDQIGAMGLDSFYDIQANKIIGKPLQKADKTWDSTTFAFEGIKNNTTKIKSYEGIDRCWVEEANKVSKTSWEILIPTIRKEDSEIWLTFNPELKTDYTYKRFVLNPSPDSFVVKMTWRDNPWFPEVLRKEMLELRERDYDAYLNVWEGHCREILEGVVYAKELRAAQEEQRITKVPWDRETPVQTFWDLGRADATAIWFAQRVGMEYRVLRYYENSGPDIHHYLQYCQSLPYTYGDFWLPHDAKAKRLGTKRSIEEIVRNSGRTVRIVPKLSIADGINAGRIMFSSLWFDESNCEEGIDRLRHYRFRVVEGQYSDSPMHDENSHAADALRYMALALRAPRSKIPLSELFGNGMREVGSRVFSGRSEDSGNNQGWMR